MCYSLDKLFQGTGLPSKVLHRLGVCGGTICVLLARTLQQKMLKQAAKQAQLKSE